LKQARGLWELSQLAVFATGEERFFRFRFGFVFGYYYKLVARYVNTAYNGKKTTSRMQVMLLILMAW
jgi:hypothetical protein